MFKLIGSIISFFTSLASLPVRMLAHNFIGTVILFSLLYFFFASSGSSRREAPLPTHTATSTPRKNQPAPLIEPVRKTQNGNSRFSIDLISQMTPPELKHYSNVFYWVMNNKNDDAPHRWAFYNIDGTITPLSRFTNSFGHECRQFSEILKVHTIRQTFSGMACQRAEETGGGWCRLRFDSTPLCGIGESGSDIFDGISQSLKNLF
jgi:hypothetical protein